MNRAAEALLGEVLSGPELPEFGPERTDWSAHPTIARLLGSAEFVRAHAIVFLVETFAAADAPRPWTRTRILRLLLQSPPELSHDEAVALLAAMARTGEWTWLLPFALVRMLVLHAEAHGCSGTLECGPAIERLRQGDADAQRAAAALRRIGSAPPAADELPLEDPEFLALVRERAAGVAWATLLRHAATAASNTASAGWRKQGAALVTAVGAPAFADAFLDWAPRARLGAYPAGSAYGTEAHGGPRPGLTVNDQDVLRGLCFLAGDLADPRAPAALAALAQRAYTKIPGWGAASKKVGAAAVAGLGQVRGRAGVAWLSRLAGRMRYDAALGAVEKALEATAQREGVPRDEIEEMSVPEFGLDASGVRRVVVGEAVAELSADGLRWRVGERSVSAPPAAVRAAHAEEITTLKRESRELCAVAGAQVQRIAQLWLVRETPWSWHDWRERYADHPLVSRYARALLWRVGGRTGLPWGGTVRDVRGEPIPEGDVTLWHPATAPPEEVLAWRDRLDTLGIVQPLRQVWREAYVITPAERETRTYSNRFAAHLLRQANFLAIARERGWVARMQGDWYQAEPPRRTVGPWTVSFWVTGVEDGGGMAYPLLSTDQVRFVRDGEAQPLDAVPPLLFSELMRDVDLFVSVTSVGTDPGWVDGSPDRRVARYWQEWAYGDLSESARTRGAALERLLPRLRIRAVAQVEGRFLVVRGKRNTYRIHLGSANIQMDGRGYLCIVPDRSQREAQRVQLPFAGDETLSVILSKAFLLADDDRITDPTILRQIGG